MTEIDGGLLIRAAKEAVLTNRKAIRERMRKHSPQIWARYELHASRLIGDMTADPALVRKSKGIAEKMMLGISWADENVISSIWRAAEIKMAKAHKVGTDAYWKAVNSEADRVIRRTQPNFHAVNASAVQRGGKSDPFMKAASMFMSQRNTNYNMLYEALASKNAKRAAAVVAVVGGIQPLLISGVDETRDWAYGRQENEDFGDLAVSLATDAVANNLSQIYFAGTLLDPAARKIANAATGTNKYVFEPSNPITSTASGILDGLAGLVDSATEGDGERAWQSLEKMLLNGAALSGIPIRSPYRAAEEALEAISPEE